MIATLRRILEMLDREDYDGARALLNAAIAERESLEQRRAKDMSQTRHDVGNELSIALASLEAMLDGVVGISDQRLNRIRDILSSVSAAVYRLTGESER